MTAETVESRLAVPALPLVLARVEGRLGHLTLNRPQRINALNLDMVRSVAATLTTWANDPDVDVVLIDGAGERGLCAGGDIREVFEGMSGKGAPPATFWAEEYAMNAQIDSYPKPVVAIMDGIVFGGGVGISAHASLRLVTERSQVAMPETAIGLSPDVGAMYLLSRSPGRLGTHCVLTGARLDGPQAVHAGLADQVVDSAALSDLAAALRTGEVPVVVESRPSASDHGHPDWIDSCYGADSVEEIVAALRGRPEPDAAAAADVISAMSPTALKVALEAIRRAATMTLVEVLEQDLRVGSRFLGHPDFAEGIRAQIIDKDRNPRWEPARLTDISREDVLAFFEPLDG